MKYLKVMLSYSEKILRKKIMEKRIEFLIYDRGFMVFEYEILSCRDFLQFFFNQPNFCSIFLRIGVEIDFSQALKFQEGELKIQTTDESMFSYCYYQLANLSRKKDFRKGDAIDSNVQKSYDLTLKKEKKNGTNENGLSLLINYRLARIHETYFRNIPQAQTLYEKIEKIKHAGLDKARTFQYEVIKEKSSRKLISLSKKMKQKIEFENIIGSDLNQTMAPSSHFINFFFDDISMSEVLFKGLNSIIRRGSVFGTGFVIKVVSWLEKHQVTELLDVLMKFVQGGFPHTNHVTGYCLREDPFDSVSVLIIQRSCSKTLSNLITENFFQKNSRTKLLFAIILTRIVNEVNSNYKYTIAGLEPSNILFEDKEYISEKNIKLNIPVIGNILISEKVSCNKLKFLSLGYAAPELFRSLSYGCLMSDVWSLGMIFYSLFLDKLLDPFIITNLRLYSNEKVVGRFSSENPPDSISEQVLLIVDKMVCFEPKHRITLKEVLVLLENL